MARSRWLLVPCLIAGCTGEPPSAGLGATPIALDGNGLPRMIATPRAPAPGARAHVERLASVWGVSPDALPELVPVVELPASRDTVVRLEQRIDGLPIDDGDLGLLIGDDGALELATGTLVGTGAPRTAARFGDPDTAIARAVAHVYGDRLATGAIAVQAARARRAWHRTGEALVAAWIVEAYAGRADTATGDAFRIVLAADGGAVLARENLTADAAFQYRVFAEPTGELHPFDGPIVDATPHPTGRPDGSYPAFVAPSLVTVDGLNHPGGSTAPDPWLVAGRTETLGNNVDAYADFNPPSGLTFGDFRATVTAPGVFDRTFDTAAHPLASQAQQMAGVASLFYNINWLHDFWYDAGFTEAAGNAQDNNYGRGGEDRDAILAEAQDNALGGSRNNANMSTPSDGLPPRMQVFLWLGQDDRTLAIAPANRTPAVGSVTWQPGVYDVTAPLALGTDAVDPITDACQPLVGNVTGKIVLVDRANCTAKTKTKNVQDAGGVGIIIANHLAGAPPNFTDDATIQGISIGTLTVAMEEGAQLRADVAAGPVTATMHRKLRELDGSLDAPLIAHEFGHYLHHRLNRCSNAICSAMSEGYGDFNALLVMARPGDDLRGAFPISVYSTVSFSGDAGYYGIRRAPYSVDPAINSLSFRHMADGTPLPTTHPFLVFGSNSEVHNAGEIWAATLWEVYVALQQQPGAMFEDVRARMKRYVVSGLRLMPVDPTPLEARDALVAVATPDDRPVMLDAFARRGMGSCAIAPAPASSNFAGIVESTVIAARAVAGPVAIDDATCDDDGVLDHGERATLAFTLANTGHAPLANAVVTPTTTTPGVTIDSAPIPIDELRPGESRRVEVAVSLDEGATGPVAGRVDLAVATPGACATKLAIAVPLRLDTDERAAASATDAFDARSIWTPVGTTAWQQEPETALDSMWHGTDLAVASDTSLVSPPIRVGGEALTVTFSHRYAFESDTTTNYDGGVIELSRDGGGSWIDVVSLGATPSYSGMLGPSTGNPLANRPAYVRANPAYPLFDTVALAFGTQLAGSTILLRFRIGTDGSAGGPGWEIDDVAFTGITGTPFPVLVADDGVCSGGGGPLGQPGGDVATGCCAAAPSHPAALGLALGVLALMLRRRRS